MSLCFQVSLHRFSLEGASFRGRTGWRGDSRLSGALHTWSVLQYEYSFRKVKPCQTCTWELTGNCYLVQSNPLASHFRGDKLRQVTHDCLLTFVSEKSRYFKFAAHTHGRVNFWKLATIKQLPPPSYHFAECLSYWQMLNLLHVLGSGPVRLDFWGVLVHWHCWVLSENKARLL